MTIHMSRSGVFRKRSMFFCLCLIIFLFLNMSETVSASASIADLKKSVFRIYVVSNQPDYITPWASGKQLSGWGSGFLVSEHLILTNAHVSSDARLILVERERDSKPYEAEVRFIAHDCDLALLRVIDSSFYEGLKPLSLGTLPELDSTVAVLGYPIGGKHLSVTRGIVSRIDYQVYSHSGVDSHLAVQIDAAINPGNSGGPVIQSDKVVGVAFQAYSGMVAQNVGYMIPTPVIRRFLKDIEDGKYDRYVDLGIQHLTLNNPSLRRALGLDPGDFGVMVTDVIKTGAAGGILRTGDVLLSINGLSISSDGNVILDGEKVLLHEVVERKFKGDTVNIDIFRDGRSMQVVLPLNSPWPYLMHGRSHDVQPRFVVYGGIVFQPVSEAYIGESETKNVNLLYHYQQFMEDDIYLERPEVIFISRILPDPVNTYSHRFVHAIVDRIDGKKIRTLEDVHQAFSESPEYHVIDFFDRHQPLVLNRKEIEEARARILSRYEITRESYLKDSIVPLSWTPNQ